MEFRSAHFTVYQYDETNGCTDHVDRADPTAGADPTAELARPVREIPGWADPYIAAILVKHRLRAALADSLDYLAREDRFVGLSGEIESRDAPSDSDRRFGRDSAW